LLDKQLLEQRQVLAFPGRADLRAPRPMTMCLVGAVA